MTSKFIGRGLTTNEISPKSVYQANNLIFCYFLWARNKVKKTLREDNWKRRSSWDILWHHQVWLGDDLKTDPFGAWFRGAGKGVAQKMLGFYCRGLGFCLFLSWMLDSRHLSCFFLKMCCCFFPGRLHKRISETLDCWGMELAATCPISHLAEGATNGSWRMMHILRSFEWCI